MILDKFNCTIVWLARKIATLYFKRTRLNLIPVKKSREKNFFLNYPKFFLELTYIYPEPSITQVLLP